MLAHDLAALLDRERRRNRELEEELERLAKLAQLGLAAEHVGDSIEFTDAQGVLIYVNPAYEQLTGYSREEALGRTPRILRSGTHSAAFYDEIWRTTEAGKVWTGLITSRRKDGSLFTADCTLSPVLDANGTLTAYMCLRRDVTKDVQEQQELRAALSRYALAAQGANDGMWGWDLQTNEVLLSARWWDMLGCPAQETRGPPESWLDRIHRDDQQAFRDHMRAHLDQTTPHLACEYRLRHQDGTWRWMLCRGLAERSETGKPVRIAGSQADIHGRKTAEQRLRFDATHDALTGLPNRLLFKDRLTQGLRRRQRKPDHQLTVLFIDLDRFKNINDSFGHPAGDRLLVEIAKRIRQILRDGDTVARLGGDEFAVLLDGMGEAGPIQQITDRLRQAIGEPFRVDGADLVVSASVGIRTTTSSDDTCDDLLRDADTAMYGAKASGRNTAVPFRPVMRSEIVGHVRIEADLRHAVPEDQLAVVYQPIFDLADREVLGFEALLRWNRPGHGVLAPDRFLDVAYEAGVLSHIERWVLDTVVTETARSGPMTSKGFVSVNISPRRLLMPDLVRQVTELLDRTGLPGNKLQLEITERSLLDDERAASIAVAELHDLGVRVCLDDFGTGYSSLAYLQRFVVDAIKIDSSFIGALPDDANSLAIVRAILAMAEALSIDVVAKGVERVDQLRQLQLLRCPAAQGFFLGRPGPLGGSSAKDTGS